MTWTKTGVRCCKQCTGRLAGCMLFQLLTCWCLSGGVWLRDRYDKSVKGIEDKLLVRTKATNRLFARELRNGRGENKMDHLVCFLPGMVHACFTCALALSPRVVCYSLLPQACSLSVRSDWNMGRTPSGTSRRRVTSPRHVTRCTPRRLQVRE